MRNNLWLNNKLNGIWQKHFPDVEQQNRVIIKFGQNARQRLGSIRQISPYNKQSMTKIIITGYFMDERVPEEIIDATIAHELAHYAHGFCSPLPQLSKYPHQGGKVDDELKKRGFAEVLKFQKKWLKDEWPQIIGPAKRRIRRRKIELINLFRI